MMNRITNYFYSVNPIYENKNVIKRCNGDVTKLHCKTLLNTVKYYKNNKY